MAAPYSREAAPAIAVSGSSKSVQLGGRDKAADTPSQLKVQALKRFTAQLDALCVWKEDLARRIADVDARLWEPNWFYSRVYQDEVDDLADATRAWRLAAARVALDLDGTMTVVTRRLS